MLKARSILDYVSRIERAIYYFNFIQQSIKKVTIHGAYLIVTFIHVHYVLKRRRSS